MLNKNDGMPMPKKEISFLINTIEDMVWNEHLKAYFGYLEILINNGFELQFYRKGNEDLLTTIRDINHLNNFKKSFKFPNA